MILDYAGAVKRIQEIQAAEGAEIHPRARSQFFTRGKKTARAMVLLHGLTNSPAQFAAFGNLLFEKGHNVWIPRLPRHGYADRMTRAHAHLTAAELIDALNHALDLARGLADRVSVAGLSMGGTLAAYAAQVRGDVDLAMLINPGFALNGLAYALTRWLARQPARLPNAFVWWNFAAREKFGPPHAYPGFYLRELAHVLAIGAEVYARAAREKPAARAILVVTSRDPGLDHAITARVVERWRARGARVAEHFFRGADVPLLHDIMDPAHSQARLDLFYPVMMDLIQRSE